MPASSPSSPRTSIAVSVSALDRIQVDPLRVPVHLDPRAGDGDPPFHAAILLSAGPGSGVGEHGARPVHLADLKQGVAQLGQRREPGPAPRGRQRCRAAEQVRRRRHVPPLERPLTCAGELVAGPVRERELPLADRAELGSVAKRPFEVIAGDLGVLGESVAGRVVNPGGKALVKLRPQALRRRSIGRLLDQDVTEAKSLTASGHRRRADQLLAVEGLEVTGDEGAGILGQ